MEYQESGAVKRVLNEDEGFVPVYEVALLDDEVESDDEMLVYVVEDQLESVEPETEGASCGFCVALDGGACVDCEGYKHMAAERTDEDRAYDAAARARSVENDPVNHPGHYNRGKIEVIDFITDQGFNYARGNAVKYISRAGYKNPDTEIEDLEKARFYIDYEIKRLKAQGQS